MNRDDSKNQPDQLGLGTTDPSHVNRAYPPPYQATASTSPPYYDQPANANQAHAVYHPVGTTVFPGGVTVIQGHPAVGPGVSTVIVGPAVGPSPSVVVCRSCNQQIVTRVEYSSSMKTHLIAALLCIVGCWPFMLVPYCVDTCKNAEHYCPHCNAYLGNYMD